MSITEIPTSRLKDVANQIEQDILRRGLGPGDRYLTAEEASRLFSVSQPIANRAMKLLAEKDVLKRHRRSGTFVSGGGGSHRPVNIQNVYFLMPSDQVETGSVLFGSFVRALRTEMGNVNVQLSFLPSRNRLDFVRATIDAARSVQQLAGVVGVSCGQEIYRYLANEHVSTVICGSFHGAGTTLPTVDVDNKQAARLLMEYLIDKGHTRIAILAEDFGRPGDHDFHDEAVDVLTEANLPANALLVRAYPGSYDAYRLQAGELLSLGDRRPTALICRRAQLAEVAREVASQLGLSVPRDLEIVYEDFAASQTAQPSFPHVQPTMLIDEFAVQVARMLNQIRRAKTLSNPKVVIPVKMVVPESVLR